MQKVFVYAPYYEKCLDSMGLTDEDARQIENAILENPKIGDVIQGTGGLRKFRIPINGQGKRGGARVLYVNFVMFDKVYLIAAYNKNEKDNISEKEKASIKKALDMFEKELKERKCY